MFLNGLDFVEGKTWRWPGGQDDAFDIMYRNFFSNLPRKADKFVSEGFLRTLNMNILFNKVVFELQRFKSGIFEKNLSKALEDLEGLKTTVISLLWKRVIQYVSSLSYEFGIWKIGQGKYSAQNLSTVNTVAREIITFHPKLAHSICLRGVLKVANMN